MKSERDSVKANRFKLLEIIVTGLVTSGLTLAASYLLSNHSLENVLKERRFASAQDLSTFSNQQNFAFSSYCKQQDVQYSNWVKQQDVQYSNWLKQQALLAETHKRDREEDDLKRNNDLQSERSEWYSRQEAAIANKLSEIRFDRSSGQDIWLRQQRFVFDKDRYDKQFQLLSELVGEIFELDMLHNRALFNRSSAGHYGIDGYSDPASSFGWIEFWKAPGSIYETKATAEEYDSLESSFSALKFTSIRL